MTVPIATCPSCSREQEVRVTGRAIARGQTCVRCKARLDAARVRLETRPAASAGTDEFFVALLEATDWRAVPPDVLAKIAAVVQEAMQQ